MERRIEKRAPDGTLLWLASLMELDYSFSLAVTPAGDALLVGSRQFGDGVHDRGVWAAKIDGATGGPGRGIQIRSDVATAAPARIVVDGQGDVIIAGVYISLDLEWWLRKYDGAIFD